MKTGIRESGPARARVRYTLLVDSANRGKVREITGVFTPVDDRGLGHAGRLMAGLCAEASNAGIALLVSPRPEDREGLGMAALVAWYERFGFEVIQADPCIMVRA